MPVAIPVSVGRTASVISVAIAANANPTPMPRNGIASRICHGSSFQIANEPAAAAENNIPATSGHLNPVFRPINPAAGPAKSSITDAGTM